MAFTNELSPITYSVAGEKLTPLQVEHMFWTKQKWQAMPNVCEWQCQHRTEQLRAGKYSCNSTFMFFALHWTYVQSWYQIPDMENYFPYVSCWWLSLGQYSYISCLRVVLDHSEVTLSMDPTFLAKNQMLSYSGTSITFFVGRVEAVRYLCPVHALLVLWIAWSSFVRITCLFLSLKTGDVDISQDTISCCIS